MARSYANILTAIWRDEDFRALSVDEQHAYLMLATQPDISAAGALSLNLVRWASRTKGLTPERLRAAIDGLEAHRFVVVDYDTEELLVRSFVRWDGGYTNSKRRFSIRDAAGQIESVALRRVLAAEFARLELPAEWVPLSPQVDSPSIAHTENEDGLSGNQEWATPKNSDIRRVVVTKDLVGTTSTLTPQTSTLVPSRSAEAPASGRRRGTRLPDDFAVTDEMKTWFAENCRGVDGGRETEKFRNYWLAKSGKDATKIDWPATWRNWMLNAAERAGPNARGPFTGATRHTSQRHDNPFAEQS